MELEMEKEHINHLFETMYSAWSNGDGEAYAACFTEDADYVTFNGQHIKGKQDVKTLHQALFDGVLKGSQLQGHITDMRFLNSTTAIVHCVGSTKMRWQKNYPKNRDSINTNIVVKQNGEWKISAFHNCRIQEPNFIAKWFMNKNKK